MPVDEWRTHKQFHPCLTLSFLIVGSVIVGLVSFYTKIMFEYEK